jgi:hypothetical protein
MTQNHRKPVAVPSPDFINNINRFPGEEYLKYRGQHVAWSLDGTCILASGPDIETLEKRLIEVGIDPSQVVGEFIPDADSIM